MGLEQRIQPFETLADGQVVHRLELGTEPGVVVSLLTLGATLHRLELTGGDGVRRNVVLGRPSAAAYLAATDYRGGTIGRYANRIAGGRFPLDGRTVEVGAHDRGQHLHGGPDGFDRRLWSVDEYDAHQAVLRLRSPDGDQGFPGTLEVTARFEVEGHRVRISLQATTGAPTVVNLTNHAYFNLEGAGTGTIDEHELEVVADHYTPIDAVGIPFGEHLAVSGTSFDTRKPVRIGALVASPEEQIAAIGGLDHNYVLNGHGLRTAAVLTSPRTLTRAGLSTDQPGLQVFTGGSLEEPRAGIALEPQLFPDTPHHPEWPSARLEPGETYRSEIVWEFGPISAGRSGAGAP
jgi:galactose mutarotase-like enzyme